MIVCVVSTTLTTSSLTIFYFDFLDDLFLDNLLYFDFPDDLFLDDLLDRDLLDDLLLNHHLFDYLDRLGLGGAGEPVPPRP